MFYWGIFVREFQKCCCHLWIQHFQFCLFGQFNNTTTMPKFRTEDSWFGYFGAGIWKQKCHTWNQHLRICLIANFSAKNKNSMFGTTNALFWFFDQKYFIWVFYLERIVKKLLPKLHSQLSCSHYTTIYESQLQTHNSIPDAAAAAINLDTGIPLRSAKTWYTYSRTTATQIEAICRSKTGWISTPKRKNNDFLKHF